jgi:hypothetical protein
MVSFIYTFTDSKNVDHQKLRKKDDIDSRSPCYGLNKSFEEKIPH